VGHNIVTGPAVTVNWRFTVVIAIFALSVGVKVIEVEELPAASLEFEYNEYEKVPGYGGVDPSVAFNNPADSAVAPQYILVGGVQFIVATALVTFNATDNMESA
jgi:hypothetical protein